MGYVYRESDRGMREMDKVIITGASDGIGKAMAEAFARRGAKLGLIARRGEILETLKSDLMKLGSPQVEIAPLDVTDSAKFRRELERLDTALGGANHFIANAGIADVSRPLADNWERTKKLLDVNVMAACDGLEFMKAKMVARRSGTLSGVSSVAGTRGLPDSGAYCASKAALTTYLESLRVDLRPYGVKVCTIAPGFIHTALTKKNRGTMPFVIQAEPAGEIFVKGLIRGEKWIVAPWQYRWIIRLLRYMPIWFYDLVLALAMGSVRGSRPEQRT